MTGKSTNVEISQAASSSEIRTFSEKNPWQAGRNVFLETGNPPSKFKRFLGNPHYQAIVELKSNITNDTPYEAPRPTAQSSSDSLCQSEEKLPPPKWYISEFSVVERQGFKFLLLTTLITTYSMVNNMVLEFW